MSSLSHRQATSLRYIGALLLYLLAAGIWYHAILAHPDSRVPCCISDGTSTLRDYMIASSQHHNILTFTHDAFNGAPEGTARAGATQLANAGLQTGFLMLLKGPLGLVGAWNLFALVGLVGTAMAVFWLLRNLGCTTAASLFGGYVVGFCPDAIGRVAAGHLGFIQNWVFVLVIVAALRVRDRRSYASAALLGLTAGLAFYISAYQGLLASLAAIVFLVVELPRLPQRPDRSRSLALLSFTLIVNALSLVPLALVYRSERSAFQANASHGNADLLYFGARVGAYLVPAPSNPLFHWLRSVHPTDVVEQTLFVGFTTIALALTACVLLFRRNAWLHSSPRRWWTAISLAVLVPVGVLFSLPPAYKAGPVPIPTPSILIAGLTSYWRVYSRIGMVSGFALAMLAALALSAITARGGWLGRSLAPVALVAVVLELLPGNISAFSTTAKPGWVAWLAAAPRGIVATYPLADNGAETGLTLRQYWYQGLDGDPGFAIANENLGGILSRQQAIRWLAVDPNVPLTARVLSREKVRYVVIDDGAYTVQHLVPPTPDPKHYKLLAHVDGFRIFSVHAPPANLEQALRAHEADIARREGLKKPKIVLQSGFGPLEHTAALVGRRLGLRGVIAVDNAGAATRVRLTGRTLNHGAAVIVRLVNGKGVTMAMQVIPAGASELRSVPLEVPAQSRFSLTVIPARAGDALYLSRLKLVPVPVYVTAAPSLTRT